MGSHLTPYSFILSVVLVLLGLLGSSCTRGSKNLSAEVDRRVDENIQSLMGLSNGMTKGEVYSLAGVANYVEGYEWGSVWRYKIRKGENDSFLAKKDVELNYMPVVFDNTDRVMGYGQKFYDQTLKDLGAGQF
jgi:hypothetical protein